MSIHLVHAPAPSKRSAEYRIYALLISGVATRVRFARKRHELLRPISA
jgi:hypothetical protein